MSSAEESASNGEQSPINQAPANDDHTHPPRTGGGRAAVIGVAAAVGVIAAFLLGSITRGDAGPAPSGGADPAADRLTMVGTGSADAVPDLLTFRVRVGVVREDVGTALADANRTAEKVLDALREAGVGERDLASNGLSVGPERERDPETSEQRTVGYRATHTTTVKVREFAGAGEVVDAAIAAGGDATSVDDLRLGFAEPDPYLADARADAVADARERAEQYAEAAGRDLGDVVTISEGGDDGYDGDFLPAGDASAALGYGFAPGEQSLTATVQVVWQLR